VSGWIRRGATLAAGGGLIFGALAAQVLPASAAGSHPSGAPSNPYSPAYGHTYRHGVVPTVAQNQKMNNYAKAHQAGTQSTGPETLAFGGGIDGIGVTSGAPKIYLVFWGNQWGTQGTDPNGNITLSKDTYDGAPYIQQLFKGLGTGGELWSGTMTQYCDGSSVATGATSCPAGAPHIGYPTGGPYAGVWYDNSAAEPTAASGHQIGQEAVNAAAHFGNTTAASNRYAQYDILSAPGLDPDNYETQGFCAWHDYNGDTTLSGGAVSSPYGDLAFTNMPYVMNAGASCGMGFVNSPGTLDGYSIVNGHEYAETVTDQNPAGGWTNQHLNSFSGEENGDECAWISSGQGASANVAMGDGSFAMQSTWSNDTNRCDISHTIFSASGNTVTVTSPGNQSATVGTAVSLQVHATDSASGQTLTYSATGLPAGLSINSSTGLISGTPTTAATYSTTVSATDTTGAKGSASFTWTVSSSGGGGGGCTSTGQKFINPGFESGSTGWSATAGVIQTNGFYSHSGRGYAWLDGYGTAHTDTLSQGVSVPAGCHVTLSYYLWISSSEPTSPVDDTLTITANGTTVQSFSQANKGSGYVLRTVDLSSFAGQTITVKWTGIERATLHGNTSFFIDDTSLTLS
jgi:Putative Ig domain